MLERVLVSALAFAMSSASSFAQEGNIDCTLKAEPTVDSALLQRLEGTVQLPTRCSASLVTVAGRSPAAKAWVLSAGHCIRMGKAIVHGDLPAPGNGEVFHDLQISTSLTLETGRTAAQRTCVTAERLLYATLTGIDIALYELGETYQDIERRTSVKPFVIADQTSIAPGTASEVPSASHRQNMRCMTGTKVDKLREFEWEWGDTYRMSLDCKFIGGFSGGPVVRADNNEIIGIAGTSYGAERAPCELDNPCEVDAQGGISVGEKGQSYFHAAGIVHECLDANKDFKLHTPTCRLIKPR